MARRSIAAAPVRTQPARSGKQAVPLPRVICPGPKAQTAKEAEEGAKRAREDSDDDDSDGSPPPAKKARILLPSNTDRPTIPDVSSIPHPQTYRIHPRYTDYVASISPVKGATKEEREKNFESDWAVACLVKGKKVRCKGCWTEKKVQGYKPGPWAQHRRRCSALMAKWLVEEGTVTEEAARKAGILFEDPKLEKTSP